MELDKSLISTLNLVLVFKLWIAVGNQIPWLVLYDFQRSEQNSCRLILTVLLCLTSAIPLLLSCLTPIKKKNVWT